MVEITNQRLLIEQTIEDVVTQDEQRDYLGMSGVGKHCMRASWYGWRWAMKNTIDARRQRIFDRGHLEEARVIKCLTAAGITVEGEQYEIIDITGHSKGHIDGVALNVPDAPKTPHLLEIKTMKEQIFNTLAKKASGLTFPITLRTEHPAYWYQIQLYMGYLKLTRCLYVITNKNTEARLYYRVHFDKYEFEIAKERTMNILTADHAPGRVAEREDWFACKMCDKSPVCYGHRPPDENCRTCKNVDLFDKGVWGCTVNENKHLSYAEQQAGCDKHEYIEFMNETLEEKIAISDTTDYAVDNV